MTKTATTAGGRGQATLRGPLDIWAGFECSIVRVGEVWRQQLAETGHLTRGNDLTAIRNLGVRTLRFPVLWEMAARDAVDSSGQLDWSWTDDRLSRVRELGMRPIAGLVHHGSGPRFTSLLDPAFPELLADYAGRVAERYPWIESYTPVNEPLTTARFSCLYGHWFPHRRETASFLRALVNQCRGIQLAMQRIRAVNPAAQLVQTEDLGRTFSTNRLRYQAAHENDRRWLSFDLLCGRVTPEHPFYGHFTSCGIAERELEALIAAPCVPDVIGINHYLTSDRYLDENLASYPEDSHGGNSRDRYADVAAVHVWPAQDELGPRARLLEAWERYQLPIAITEVHNGCTREEQLRWLSYVYDAAIEARAGGADVRALTLWAAAGCYDWSSLLTARRGHYEPGLFDARREPIRPTVLAKATKRMAAGKRFDHPVLDDKGWWQRGSRTLHLKAEAPRRRPCGQRRLLITGRTGTLGQAFGRVCEKRFIAADLVGRGQMDIAERDSVRQALEALRPWAVINTAGFVRTWEADEKRELCLRENVQGAQVLAQECERLGIALMTFSSDLVFDGRLGRAYVESDIVTPLCTYGLSKAQAEAAVSEASESALIVRTSAFFGPWDRYNAARKAVESAEAGCDFEASDKVAISPTYVPDLVNVSLDLLIDGAQGIWHVANEGRLTWYEFLRRVLVETGADQDLLKPDLAARRRCTALASGRGVFMPPVEEAIERFAREGRL